MPQGLTRIVIPGSNLIMSLGGPFRPFSPLPKGSSLYNQAPPSHQAERAKFRKPPDHRAPLHLPYTLFSSCSPHSQTRLSYTVPAQLLPAPSSLSALITSLFVPQAATC